MTFKNSIFTLFFVFITINLVSSQSISCTRELSTLQPSDINNSNWVVPSNGTTCVSSNLTVAYLEIANGGTLIIKPGVILTITGNIRPDNIPTRNSTIQVYGELRFTQSATIPMSTNLTIYSAGKLMVGNNGTSNISFKGNVTNILNNGTLNVGTIDINNNSSVNTFENQGNFTVSGNINIQGTTYFKNTSSLIINASFNNNSNSVYVNCGTFTTSGFNLQGGKIYNIGSFTATGNINFGSSTAFFENYGSFNGAGIQLGGGSSYVYNSGNFTLTSTFQNDGNLRGPASGTNYGRFVINGKSSINNGTVTGRLNLINGSNANSNASTMFNNGINVASTVVFGACSACTVVTTGAVCLNPDGSMPITVDAVADNLTSTANGGTTTSVFANDVYNGGTAGSVNSTNVNLAQVGTWPAGFTLNANGTISVASGTPASSYNLEYRICAQLAPTSCDNAIATVIVSPTVDAVADSFSATGSQAVTGIANIGNVLANDTFNAGAAGSATTNNVAISVTTAATPAYVGAPIPALNTTTGVVSIPTGTPAGTYTITYQLCEKISGTQCDSASTTITVAAPAMSVSSDNLTTPADGSTTISLLSNDTFNGGAAGSATPDNVTVAKEGVWPIGITLNPDGTLTVAQGTQASTHVLDYKICDKLNPANCMNAVATITIINCFQPVALDPDAGSSLDTATGITSLNRAGTASKWPAVRKSGWIVLEAKTKGFVLNRVRFNASNQPVAADGSTPVITAPVEGMMVYDITNNCLKVYTTTDGVSFAWYCMETQACQ
jgi:hypothetical protein